MFIKLVALTLIPKLAGDIYDYIAKGFNDLTDSPSSVNTPMCDRTKFTKEMYDYATKEFSTWQKTGATSEGVLIYTHIEFAAHLNAMFNTSKSVSSMRRLYKGTVDRENLPSNGVSY